MRFFLELAYNGKSYHGWQVQNNARTVQGELEIAFLHLMREKITINGSSRTDTGVHARQQYAHFDTLQVFDIPKMIYKLNSYLGDDIRVKQILKVDISMHSRFDAISRKYIYQLIREKDPFQFENALYFNRYIDFQEMNVAAQILLKHTDFQCFSKVKTEVNNFNCDIQRAEWVQNGNIWEFHIQANRFLRGMVRAIVGTLIEVGLGKLSMADFENVIISKNRNEAGAAVEAKGLFLTEVNYPKSYFAENEN